LEKCSKQRGQKLILNEVFAIKPSHHTKQKWTEHLPLSSVALQLLLTMHEVELDSDFLFPGRFPDKPLQDVKGFWQSIMLITE